MKSPTNREPLEIPATLRTRMFAHVKTHSIGTEMDAIHRTKTYAASSPNNTTLILRRHDYTADPVYQLVEMKDADPNYQGDSPLSHLRYMPQQVVFFDGKGNAIASRTYQYEDASLPRVIVNTELNSDHIGFANRNDFFPGLSMPLLQQALSTYGNDALIAAQYNRSLTSPTASIRRT